MVDIMVLLMLGATIFYTVLVNRRLTNLQKGRDELQSFVESFGESLHQAERSIHDLKETGGSILDNLHRETEIASKLRDELLFLNERGEKLASDLEQTISSSRELTKKSKNMPSKNIKLQSEDPVVEEADESLLLRTLIHVR